MAICKSCGCKYSKFTTPVSARSVCRDCFFADLAAGEGNTPAEHPGPIREAQEIVPKQRMVPIHFISLLPRSRSRLVFVLVMACYGLFAAGLLRTVADAFGAQHTQPGIFLQRGHPTLEVISLLVFAPIIESLILIAMIELLRWLRSPVWLQIALPAIISAAQHVPVSHAVVVTPSWFIMAAAYVMWRQVSRKTAFVVIASIHALVNLNPAIWTIGYAIHHRNV